MAELTKSTFKKVGLSEPADFSDLRRPNRNQLSKTQKTKKSSKILDDNMSSLDSTIEILNKPSELSEPGTGAGERFAISVKEMTIKDMHDNNKYLENKLKNNNLTLAEYRKISDDIDQKKKNLPKKEQELEDDKKDLEKTVIIYQARSFEDQNK